MSTLRARRVLVPTASLLVASLLGACSESGAERADDQLDRATTPPLELDLSPLDGPSPGSAPEPGSTSTTSAPEPLPELTDPRVFMVGDSVLAATTLGQPDALDLYVGNLGWDITVDARVSRFTDEGRRVVAKRRSEIGQVMLMVLGHNYDGDEVEYREDLDEMLADVPGVRAVFMVTVPLHEPVQAEVNEVIRELAADDDRVRIIEWESYLSSHPDDGLLIADDLHPTAYGADVLAELIGVALGIAPGWDPTTPLPIVGWPNRPALREGVSTNKGESSPSIGGSPGSVPTGSGTTTTSPSGATTTTRPDGEPPSTDDGTPTTGNGEPPTTDGDGGSDTSAPPGSGTGSSTAPGGGGGSSTRSGGGSTSRGGGGGSTSRGGGGGGPPAQ